MTDLLLSTVNLEPCNNSSSCFMYRLVLRVQMESTMKSTTMSVWFIMVSLRILLTYGFSFTKISLGQLYTSV